MAAVFLNGEFVDRDDARVSAFDAAFQHAVGLFETMLGVAPTPDDARIVGLEEHTARLAESARVLGLSTDINGFALAEACLETLRRSGLKKARVRLSVTGGDLNLLQQEGRSGHTPTLFISAQPATEYPAQMYDEGVMVAVADAKANPFDPTASHKTPNYWWRLRELQRVSSRGAAEALIFQVSNHLSGGAVSNAIAIHGDRVLTPICRGEEPEGGIPSPVLPGVTRGMALGWLEERGLEISRQMVTIGNLLDADEVVLTNSSWGVLPVTRIETKEIGTGKVGAVLGYLVDRWRALISG